MSTLAIVGFVLMVVLMVVLIKGWVSPPVAFIILPLIAFFLYELVRFIMVVMSLKGKKTEDEIRQRVMEELLRAQQAAQTDAPAAASEPAAPAEEPKPEEGSENKE